MGGPSLYMTVLAAEGQLPTRLSISADTGSELDRAWNTGERTTAKEYFDRVIEPYARENGIEAVFVRALDKDGEPLVPIIDLLEQGITAGVPLYGSNGGQLAQRCTGKWKIRAVRQELRRRNATSARVALGLTMSEIHRMKPSDVKWCENWWPLIDMRVYRAMVQEELERRDIPYLLSSECDNCPHKNAARWARTSPEMIDRLAEIEAGLDGLYFTPFRIPLKEAIKKMYNADQIEMFGCDSGGYCWT
jgi:hypothetical protein